MKPGARLQAAITLLDKVLVARAPADHVVTNYFRHCRYMGVKDRRVISEIVYQVLRRYEELSWYLQAASATKPDTARLLVLLYSHKIQNLSLAQIKDLCSKEGPNNQFNPDPLTSDEYKLLQEAGHLGEEKMPLSTRLNVPSWALLRLQTQFGEQLVNGVKALNQPAPFDLRVNTLKATRKEILDHLKNEGFEATSTPWSPIGIRLGERRPLSGHDLWKQGKIEVQDEGSQLISLLVDAKPGMTILDFCAGAGGKTLAMAALMQNKGHIVATDVSGWRLNRSRERLRRAGVHNVEFRNLEEDKNLKWLKRQTGRFDSVLIDVPCSGSGTWRRNPDLKRRFIEQDLQQLIIKQQEILSHATALVKDGGRLIYVTCSLFAEENDFQVQKFLNTHPDFHLIPIPKIWSSVLEIPCPVTTDTLHLMPHLHFVDGFFMGILGRRETSAN